MSRPYMRWYAGDYDRKTQHLSLAEHGAYRRLIDTYWTNGGPIYQRNIPTILGVSRTIFERRYLKKLSPFFYVIDGEWYHKRIEREMQEFDNNRKRRAAAGALGGLAKAASASNAVAKGLAKGLAKASISDPVPEREERNKEERSALARGSVVLSSFERFWLAWPNKVGKPMAAKAFTKSAGEIDAIVAGVERYIRDKPPDRPWLNPATFLNQRRWEDAPAPVMSAPQARDNGRGGAQSLLAEIYRKERIENEQRSQETLDSGDVLQLPIVQPEPRANGNLDKLISASFKRV